MVVLAVPGQGELVHGHLVKWPDNSHAQLPGLTHLPNEWILLCYG